MPNHSGAAVLVADDDDGFRDRVCRLLERAGYIPLAAATGNDVLAIVDRERPPLILLEVQLPDVSGYEICRELRDAYGEELAIIFVSGARTEHIDRVAGLLIGADDYLRKPVHDDELLARVRRCVARTQALGLSRRTTAPTNLESLSSREREVLRLLAEGLDVRSVAERLFISPKTVGTHIQHILSKLNVHTRTAAVALAVREELGRLQHDRTIGTKPRRGPLGL